MENGHSDAPTDHDSSPLSSDITNTKLASVGRCNDNKKPFAYDPTTCVHNLHNQEMSDRHDCQNVPHAFIQNDQMSGSCNVLAHASETPVASTLAVDESGHQTLAYSVPVDSSTGRIPACTFQESIFSVTSAVPYMSQSISPGYSASVNLIRPVPDPGLIPGYPSSALLSNPHVAPYGPTPIAPLMVRPTGPPYVSVNPMSGHFSPSDLQGIPTQPDHVHASLYSSPQGPDMCLPSDNTPDPTLSSFIDSVSNNATLSAPVSDACTASDRNQSDYYVMVHVDAGATFSVRVGDQIQHIPGPATVRMVSNSGPPIPMPMQVPAGHLVQQIVDEEGILKHVILSLYPGPTPVSAPTAVSGTPMASENGACGDTGVVLDSPLQPSSQTPSVPPHNRHLHHPLHHQPHHHHHHHHLPPVVANAMRAHVPGSLVFSQYAHSHPTLGHYYPQFVPHAPHLTTTSASQHLPPPATLAPYVTSTQLCNPSMEAVAPQLLMVNGGFAASPAVEPQVVANEYGGKSSVTESDRGIPNEYVCSSQVLSRSVGDSVDEPVAEFPVASDDNANVCELSITEAQSTPHVSNSNSSYSRSKLETTPDAPSPPQGRDTSPSAPTAPCTSTPSFVTATSSPSSPHVSSKDKQRTAPSLPVESVMTPNKSETHSSPPARHQTVLASSNEPSPTYSPVMSSTRRRGRIGMGKSHGVLRAHNRLTSSGSVKCASVVSSVTNGYTTVSTTSPNPHDSTQTSVESVTSRPTSGWSADSHNHLNNSAHRVPVQSRSFLSSWPSVPHQLCKGRRSQPNYLLNTPLDHSTRTPAVDSSIEDCPPVNSVPGFSEDKTIQQLQQQRDGAWKQDVIQTVLSAVPSPQVSDVKSCSALIHLTLPDDLTVHSRVDPNIQADVTPHRVTPTKDETLNTTKRPVKPSATVNGHCTPPGNGPSEVWQLDENTIQFELHLAERDCATRFNCVFVGEATDISLQDLRPGTDYYVKFCCVYSDIRGQFSSVAHFTTTATEPSAPRNLTVVGHTRTSLHLKWSASVDNGSRITSYCVEYAPAVTRNHTSWARDSNLSTTESLFVEGFRGLARTCKLGPLAPSTMYLIRVMAQNVYGQSPWSSVVSGSTSGSPPATPPTPFLVTAGVHALTLAWHPDDLADHRPPSGMGTHPASEVSYTLEMDDEAMGHGFVTVFDGTGTEHCVENLRRNTRYHFRLAASNVDGRSRWTDVVIFSTLPDRPSAPRNLRLAGSVRSMQLSFTWDTPEDDGGLPIQAYRLELRLPSLVSQDEPEEQITEHTRNTPSTVEVGDTLPNTTSADVLQCWPTVIGVVGNTTFACASSSTATACSIEARSRGILPKPVQSHPSSSLDSPILSECSLCCQPCLSSESLSPSGRLFATHNSTRETTPSVFDNHCLHRSPLDSQSRSYRFKWFVVYEGSGNTVTVDNLLPGLHLLSRVRAVSAVSCDTFLKTGLWGAASHPPLKVAIPPVPPSAPASAPRFVGQPKPTMLRLSWLAPGNTGGAPILGYELCQVIADPLASSDEDSDTDHLASPFMDDQSGSSTIHANVPETILLRISHGCRIPRSRSFDSKLRLNTNHSELSGTHARTYSVSYPECRVSNLRPGRSYAFRVRACNMIGRGPWSVWATLTTTASPPAAPTHPPRLLPLSATTVVIMWDAVKRTNGAVIQNYLLEWQSCPTQKPNSTVESSVSVSDSRFQLLYAGPALSFQFDGTQPASRLAFRVCAVNAAGPGRWSPVNTCLTPSSRPGQPSGLRVSNCHFDTVSVQWTIPQTNGSPITSFQLKRILCSSDGETELSQLFDIPAPRSRHLESPNLSPKMHSKQIDTAMDVVQYAFTDLSPNTTYSVRVRALNSLGYGSYSAPIVFTTLPLPPRAPVFGTATQLTSNSVRLQWHVGAESDGGTPTRQLTGRPKPSVSTVLRYTLQSSLQRDCDWTTVFEGTETTFKVSRLLENSTYYFRVRASNQTGPGDFSETLHLITPRLPPPAVRSLKVTEVGPDDCQLEWSTVPPVGNDSVIYAVHVLPLVSQSSASHPQAQVYRGSQTACHVTDLLVNTEYVARVCAIRLCQPGFVPIGPVGDFATNVNGDNELKSLYTDWQRQALDGSVYCVNEISGPYSHSVTFLTRSPKSPVSDYGALNHIQSNVKQTSNILQKLWLLLSWRSRHSVLESPISTSLAPTQTTGSSWRRRTWISTSPVVPQSSPQALAKSSTSTHSSPSKRSHQWFRLSDRKLAFLFLLLFAFTTLLVSWSLQCFLATQPSTPSAAHSAVHLTRSNVDI